MKLTAGRNKWLFGLMLGSVIFTACSPKITGTWYYKSITKGDSIVTPVAYGDALNLHSFDIQVFDYNLRASGRSGTGNWTIARCGKINKRCLQLTYHPAMVTRTFRIERHTKKKLRFSENGVQFQFSRTP
jgi:hypothetical protein